MQCPFCGARNSAEAIYCRLCAKRLAGAAGERPEQIAAQLDRPGRKDTAWRLGIGLTLGMTIALMAAVWFFVSRGAPSDGIASAPQSPPAEPPPMTTPSPARQEASLPAVLSSDQAASVANDKSLQLKPIPEAPSTAGRAAQGAASGRKARTPGKESDRNAQLSQPPPLPVSQAATVPAGNPLPLATLATELAACSSQGLLSAAVCKEKVRWKYCQGKWGAIPECPKPVDPSEGGG